MIFHNNVIRSSLYSVIEIEGMFNIQRSIVSSFTVGEIHSLSLRILDEIGIPIQSERAIEILDAAGCRINRDRKRVFIPEDVVSKALNTAVSRYSLYERSGVNEIPIGILKPPAEVTI